MAPRRMAASWTETVLHSFSGAGDGPFPYGALTTDAKGNLYGTAAYGGAQHGVVFRLAKPAKSGGVRTKTVLHAFQGSDGGYPFAGVIFGANGSLYGTTPGGVGSAFGTAFELTPPAGGGSNTGFFGDGVIFELPPPVSGGGWTACSPGARH